MITTGQARGIHPSVLSLFVATIVITAGQARGISKLIPYSLPFALPFVIN